MKHKSFLLFGFSFLFLVSCSPEGLSIPSSLKSEDSSTSMSYVGPVPNSYEIAYFPTWDETLSYLSEVEEMKGETLFTPSIENPPNISSLATLYGATLRGEGSSYQEYTLGSYPLDISSIFSLTISYFGEEEELLFRVILYSKEKDMATRFTYNGKKEEFIKDSGYFSLLEEAWEPFIKTPITWLATFDPCLF